MHLGPGALTPECVALTWGAASVGLGWGWHAARQERLATERWLLAGTLGGLVMAAQAWNVPVLAGISGHLVGGVLLAWTLGPGLGMWTMAGILFLQAMLLGDGSLSAWGANTLNMGLVPALCVLAMRRWLPAGSDARSEMFGVAISAAASVVLAALLLCGEVAIGRVGGETSLAAFCQQMLGAHLVLGGLEAALTLPLAACLLPSVRQDAARAPKRLAILGCLTLVLVPLSLWGSSQLPDGYEFAATNSGWAFLLTETAAATLSIGSEVVGLCLAVVLAAGGTGLFARLTSPRWRAAPAHA